MKEADNLWRQALGLPDEHVTLYRTLKADDFSRLSQKYGVDATIDYVATMEGLKKPGG